MHVKLSKRVHETDRLEVYSTFTREVPDNNEMQMVPSCDNSVIVSNALGSSAAVSEIHSADYCLLVTRPYAGEGISCRRVSVYLSVCHTSVLCRNGCVFRTGFHRLTALCFREMRVGLSAHIM